MTRTFLVLVVSLFATNLMAKTLAYEQGVQKFEGRFYAAVKKNAPGVVLIHNWMGVTNETEKQAHRFQQLGYNVLAADIYGAGIRPTNAQEAGALATKYKTDRQLLRQRIALALNELGKQPGVDKNNIAVLGYCFGGTAAIEAARSGANIKAAISFHGGLDSPSPKDGANIKAKVLALHGAIDPYVAAKDVEAFEKEMQTYRVDYELIKYSGAVHSFTDVGAGEDISKGAAYNAAADKKSFARAKEFLADAFGK